MILRGVTIGPGLARMPAGANDDGTEPLVVRDATGMTAAREARRQILGTRTAGREALDQSDDALTHAEHTWGERRGAVPETQHVIVLRADGTELSASEQRRVDGALAIKDAIVSRHVILDPAAPMASLRIAAGITKAEMARARGVTAPTIDSSEAAGAGVRLSTLIEAAATVGCRVEIHLVKERS